MAIEAIPAGDFVLAHNLPAIVRSDASRRLIAMVGRVAATSAAVLIEGETGSGKEFVARAIHQFSLRKHKPWIDVNCSALPEHLLESELFGYEKGAFSGADTSKPGMFAPRNSIKTAAGTFRFSSERRSTLFFHRFADHHVRVESRLAILLHDIACKREHLNLFLNRNLLVVLALPVKEAECDFAEGTNCAQVRVGQPIQICEFE